MFSGNQSTESTKSVTVQLTPGNDDLFIRPTQASKKITTFQSWMEAWNIYLAILVDHAPTHAPSLIAYQCIITSASSYHPPSAWLNYDVRFRTLAAADPLLQWDIHENELWLEFFSGSASGGLVVQQPITQIIAFSPPTYCSTKSRTSPSNQGHYWASTNRPACWYNS